jgi:hypothetical protein
MHGILAARPGTLPASTRAMKSIDSIDWLGRILVVSALGALLVMLVEVH